MSALPPLTQQQRTKLRNARIKRGLTQAELGERIDVTSQAITMYESGQRIPSLETLKAICAELGFVLKVKITKATVTITEKRK